MESLSIPQLTVLLLLVSRVIVAQEQEESTMLRPYTPPPPAILTPAAVASPSPFNATQPLPDIAVRSSPVSDVVGGVVPSSCFVLSESCKQDVPNTATWPLMYSDSVSLPTSVGSLLEPLQTALGLFPESSPLVGRSTPHVYVQNPTQTQITAVVYSQDESNSLSPMFILPTDVFANLFTVYPDPPSLLPNMRSLTSSSATSSELEGIFTSAVESTPMLSINEIDEEIATENTYPESASITQASATIILTSQFLPVVTSDTISNPATDVHTSLPGDTLLPHPAISQPFIVHTELNEVTLMRTLTVVSPSVSIADSSIGKVTHRLVESITFEPEPSSVTMPAVTAPVLEPFPSSVHFFSDFETMIVSYSLGSPDILLPLFTSANPVFTPVPTQTDIILPLSTPSLVIPLSGTALPIPQTTLVDVILPEPSATDVSMIFPTATFDIDTTASHMPVEDMLLPMIQSSFFEVSSTPSMTAGSFTIPPLSPSYLQDTAGVSSSPRLAQTPNLLLPLSITVAPVITSEVSSPRPQQMQAPTTLLSDSRSTQIFFPSLSLDIFRPLETSLLPPFLLHTNVDAGTPSRLMPTFNFDDIQTTSAFGTITTELEETISIGLVPLAPSPSLFSVTETVEGMPNSMVQSPDLFMPLSNISPFTFLSLAQSTSQSPSISVFLTSSTALQEDIDNMLTPLPTIPFSQFSGLQTEQSLESFPSLHSTATDMLSDLSTSAVSLLTSTPPSLSSSFTLASSVPVDFTSTAPLIPLSVLSPFSLRLVGSTQLQPLPHSLSRATSESSLPTTALGTTANFNISPASVTPLLPTKSSMLQSVTSFISPIHSPVGLVSSLAASLSDPTHSGLVSSFSDTPLSVTANVLSTIPSTNPVQSGTSRVLQLTSSSSSITTASAVTVSFSSAGTFSTQSSTTSSYFLSIMAPSSSLTNTAFPLPPLTQPSSTGGAVMTEKTAASISNSTEGMTALTTASTTDKHTISSPILSSSSSPSLQSSNISLLSFSPLPSLQSSSILPISSSSSPPSTQSSNVQSTASFSSPSSPQSSNVQSTASSTSPSSLQSPSVESTTSSSTSRFPQRFSVLSSTVTPTSSLCSPYDNSAPPSGSVLSIILAVNPSDLSKLRELGSFKRCQLMAGLADVYKIGLSKRGDVVDVRKRNVESHQDSGEEKRQYMIVRKFLEKIRIFSRQKRQSMSEKEYTAVITAISDADSIGDNLAEVNFFVLDTTDSAVPLPINSSMVLNAYVLADVDEISGYIVVQAVQAVEQPSTSSSSDMSTYYIISAVIAATVLVVLVMILIPAFILCWRRRQGSFRLQVQRGVAPKTTGDQDRTLVQTDSFQYDSCPGTSQQPQQQQQRSSLSVISDDSSESSETQSVTRLAELAHTHPRSALEETFVPTDSFRYESRPGKRSTTVTLAQLAHSHVNGTEGDDLSREEPLPAAIFERVAHYNFPPPSPHPLHCLPPLQPRFHRIPSLPPPSRSSPPHQSPPSPSTFRRLPSPVQPTPTKTDEDDQVESKTPHRRVKKKVRSVTSVHRTRDDLREGLIVQQMVVQEAMNEEEELWHRKRATMEYYKYISGQESSFHPSILSFRQQRPITLPSLAGQSLVMPARVSLTPADTDESQPLNAEDDDRENEDISENEESELSAASMSDLPGATNTGNHEQRKRSDKTHAQLASSGGDNLTEHSPMHSEFQTHKKRKKGLKMHHRHRIAPLPYTPDTTTTVPQQIGRLAWMETVNGAQLMSIQPILFSSLQPPPPHYVLPPQASVSPMTPYHYPYPPSPTIHSTYSHPVAQYTPHTCPISTQPSSAGPHRWQKKERRREVREGDFVDGESEGAHPESRREDEQSETEREKDHHLPKQQDREGGVEDPDNAAATSSPREKPELELKDESSSAEKKQQDSQATTATGYSVQELIQQAFSTSPRQKGRDLETTVQSKKEHSSWRDPVMVPRQPLYGNTYTSAPPGHVVWQSTAVPHTPLTPPHHYYSILPPPPPHGYISQSQDSPALSVYDHAHMWTSPHLMPTYTSSPLNRTTPR